MKIKNNQKLKMCASCRKYFDEKDLIRLVKNKNGDIFIQKEVKLEGRGLHICNSKNCIENAIKRNQIKRNLRAQEVSEDIYEELRKFYK